MAVSIAFTELITFDKKCFYLLAANPLPFLFSLNCAVSHSIDHRFDALMLISRSIQYKRNRPRA